MGFNRTSNTETFKQQRHHQASFRGVQGIKRYKRFAYSRRFPGIELLFCLYSQRFLTAHAAVHNLFNLGRHLVRTLAIINVLLRTIYLIWILAHVQYIGDNARQFDRPCRAQRV